MNVKQSVSEFEGILNLRNLADGTVVSYVYWIERFLSSFDFSDTSEIELRHALEFMTALQTANMAGGTINTAMNAIRYYYEVMLDQVYTSRQLPKIKYSIREINVFSQEELEALIGKASIRVKCFILLGCDCGLRSSEVARLRFEDLSSEKRRIRIFCSKNGKSRTVKMSDTVLNALLDYCRNERPGVRSGYLFINRHGDHLSPSTVSSLFRKLMRCTLSDTENRRFHTLRHTFATMILKGGGDLFLLKKLLGHKSLSATVRYIHYYNDDIDDAVMPSELMKWGKGK